MTEAQFKAARDIRRKGKNLSAAIKFRRNPDQRGALEGLQSGLQGFNLHDD